MTKRKRNPVERSARRLKVKPQGVSEPIGFVGLPGHKPAYETQHGEAHIGDSLTLMRRLPDESIDLVMTSPPFALTRKKAYGNASSEHYVDWFMPFAYEVHRVLRPTGSFVVDIGGTWQKGSPTRSVYQYELLLRLAARFEFAQEFFWYNPSKLPGPAEWVTVRRERVTDAVNPIWWMAKTTSPKANNRRVLRPYSDSMKQLLKNGYRAKLRPSGHQISTKFGRDAGGSIPHNLLQIANTESNSAYLRACRKQGIVPHPARFPEALPAFFISFLTEPGDLVLDPFAGSNVTGRAAESLLRRWISIDLNADYIEGSRFRFDSSQGSLL